MSELIGRLHQHFWSAGLFRWAREYQNIKKILQKFPLASNFGLSLFCELMEIIHAQLLDLKSVRICQNTI